MQIGSLLILLLIFTTIPNGTTVDQLVFILINVLGQINVLVGQRLNAQCLLSRLQRVECISTESRTAVFAYLLRRYSAYGGDTSWAEAVKLLPKTDIWHRWRDRVVKNMNEDPKKLYDPYLRRNSSREESAGRQQYTQRRRYNDKRQLSEPLPRDSNANRKPANVPGGRDTKSR